MAVQDYKINYKSDFVLNINGDAGWAIPFCIKFWTGMPSQAYFVGFDGVKYVNCKVGDTPTQLIVMFDDHHLPIGKLRMQIAYHTTIAEFPGSVFDEVTNARDVIVTIDGTDYQVMLDFTGEDAPELEFNLPAYANEAERIQNELQRQQNEADRIAAELQREQATAAAVQGAENVNAQLNGNILTVTNRQGVSTSVNTKGEQGEQGPIGPEGPQGEQGETGISIVSFTPKSETSTTLIYTVTFSDGHTQDVPIPKGAKGDTGATGPQGPQGDTGVSITGMVETGETTTDTIYNITFSNGTTQQVSIPKGAKGDTGEQGPVGPQGPQGPMGDVAVITPEQQASFTMYSTTGQNTNGPMTQKAVTDAINDIDVLLRGGETTESINLGSVIPTKGYINGGTGKWVLPTNDIFCLFVPIPTYAETFSMTANNAKPASYTFLKSTSISQNNMDYATGYTNRIQIVAGSSISGVNIPEDAHYLYLYYGVSGESLPSYAAFKYHVDGEYGDIEYNDNRYVKSEDTDITDALSWNAGYNIWASEEGGIPVGALHQTSAPHSASNFFEVKEGDVLELTMLATKVGISVGMCFYGSEDESDVIQANTCEFVGYTSTYEYSAVNYIVPKGAHYFRTTKLSDVSGFYAKIKRLVNYGPVNAKLLGAAGDGVTDDTAILQELIDANDYVYIPSGEYLIHSTIRVGEGKRVIGDGCGATVLKLASSFNLLGYAWRGTAGASTIHSTISPMLAIEGNDVLVEGIGTHDGNTFTEQYGKTRAGILVVNSSNVSVRNCGATDINTIDPEDGNPENGECAGFGLYVLGSSNVIVDGGRYYNCGYECIGVETSHAVFIENADIDTGWRCACQVHKDAYDVHFDNNRIVQDLGSDTYTSGAIILDGRSTDGLWDIFIRGNWIYARTPDWNVTDGGIKCVMANEYNVIITGNTIDVSHYAISDQNYEQTYLNNPRNWIISNNIIKSLYKGICHERISNIIINGNLIDCPEEAVKVKTGCVVDNNIFLDNSTVTYI